MVVSEQRKRLASLGEARKRVLEALLNTESGRATLTPLSQGLLLSAPTVLHHLRALEAEGLVEHHPDGSYTAVSVFYGFWVVPSWGRVLEWQTARGLSWRFPLASRVPDQPAQEVLVRLLEEADRRGVFHPWVGQRGPAMETDSGFPAGLSLIVYGSCARGDAGPKSDLDLLAIQGRSHDFRPALGALAKEATLWSERRVDLRVIQRAEYDSLPRGLRSAIESEGITVLPGLPGRPGFFVEEICIHT